MKILVIGSGGIGGFFGGMLARAGHEVTCIARGEHLDAIRNHGLKIVRDKEEFLVHPHARNKPKLNCFSDLVLFTVKTYDNNSAIGLVRDCVDENTTILTLQNGVESYKQLERIFGPDRVLAGAAYIESKIERPGVIKQTGNIVRIVFGRSDGKFNRETKIIEMELNNAGILAELSSTVIEKLWAKFIFIASVAGVSAACRTRLGVLMETAEYRELLTGTMKEIEAVGRQQGICLDRNICKQTMEYVTKAVKDIMASMHLDLEKGRKLELDALNGSVARMGREVGIETPLNQAIYLVLKPFAGGSEI